MRTGVGTMSQATRSGTRDEARAPQESMAQMFGADCFGLSEMQRRLPRPVFEAIQSTIRSGEKLDMGSADAVAEAMKEWALERGATHYTHWFQPLTGATAEKHDSFLSLDDGRAITHFGGRALIQAEPDASSFPSGGMRSTFEARGYTAWDPTSPAFLIESEHGSTLTIPSVFVSYTGEALDTKTPLLRTMRELSRAATHALRLMGRDARRVDSTLGCEQEYFLVEREWYMARPDLEVTGRTVLGSAPPKGQQLEDNYFGTIDSRALGFMGEVEQEAWRLGIPLKTRHNEVAPHQYEAAPIFQPINVAADQNQLLMDILRKVARRRGLAVLLHEKPFAGVNGSGKHNNWSMQDERGRNLLEPGKEPDRNVEFLFFLAAVLKAVHRRGDLLRAGVASAANDHRLGANEAPPAIVSVFLGQHLTEILEALLESRPTGNEVKAFVETGLATLPEVRRDNTDRNRTSPFAFTGNKFEFRAVGSSQSTSIPMAFLNVAVTEAVDELSDRLAKRLDGGEDRNAAILAVVREAYTEAKPIVFNGNNYGQEWVEEAARRGLPNLADTPAALGVLERDDVKDLFQRYHVLQGHELDARYRILLERFNRMIQIEAVQQIRMVKTGVLPAAYRQQADMAAAYDSATKFGGVAVAQQSEMQAYMKAVAATIDALNGVRAALRDGPDEEHEPLAAARHKVDVMRPAMEKLRTAADTIERRTDEGLWPYPTYHQMLFQ
ncbi:MAG: glutamine synthetase III [Planctomycetes bacterium]|nr:glutamine synthetase III [Planctomycetota bacterium]MCB9826028.1 glutamine synthetase III [Planctomycetota bacterium]MCB9829216.1 glutamine synthetase III [Planctomycetota bacterium]